MRLYEYDPTTGFLIGWHEDNTRANSTAKAPAGIAPARARWDGSAWVEDSTREAQVATVLRDDVDRDRDAYALLRGFDFNTATVAEMRPALAALARLVLRNARG